MIGPGRRVGVQTHNRLRQRVHERDIEPPSLGETIEERVLIETHHLDQPLDRRTLAANRKRTVRFAGNGTHATVQRRRRPAVQPHLSLARDAPQVDRGEIHVVVTDGAFEFERPIARQPYDADVRVDALDGSRAQAVRLRRREEGDDLILLVGPHSGLPRSSGATLLAVRHAMRRHAPHLFRGPIDAHGRLLLKALTPGAGIPALSAEGANELPTWDGHAWAGRLLSSGYVTTGLLALPSPRLPARRLTTNVAPVAIAGGLHLLALTVIVLASPPDSRRSASDEPIPAPAIRVVLPPRMVFVPNGAPGGGGGGGGNRQRGPIRHAEGIGHDAVTMRTAKRPPEPRLLARDPEVSPIVLDALPMASGTFDQIGLPVGGVSYGTSTGSGSGGGVGTGTGTGIGEGRGPGVGPGSGGGFGGGAYRPGGAVTAPRVLSQVKPRYTSDALEQKIQGSVWLEVVVTRKGRAGDVRVARSLDPAGLDEQAIDAVRQWQFEPGRLAGTPVDVLVTVVMDFSIR